MNRFAEQRRAMVLSQLRPIGVTDMAVLGAMAAVGREDFVPPEVRATAYADAPLALGGNRALNPPGTTAQLLSALALLPGERLLVVGSAGGYVLALARHMGVEAVGVECEPGLLALARSALASECEGPNPVLIAGALEDGAPGEGESGQPAFDAILIDGAIAELPQALIGQLKAGGRLAAAVVDHGVSRLALGVRAGEALRLIPFADFAAVPLPGFARARQFSF